MEVLMLLILLAAVGALFLPGILRTKVLNSPLQTVTNFRRGMLALATQTRGSRSEKHGGVMYKSRDSLYASTYPEEEWEDDEDYYNDSDITPYPQSHRGITAETRRQRIIVCLLGTALFTGIMALVPSMKWIIPFHFIVLVILAIYFLLVMLLPHYYRERH